MMNAGDIAFPHLGIYLENVPRSFSVFGFEIAFYGLIIGIGVTGTSHSNVIIPDAAIRKAYRTQRDADHYGSLSPFMRAAVLAAYTDEGKAWIDELMDFVHENESLVRDCFARCMPAVKLLRHRAGTLIWADFRGLGLSELELERFFLSAGVEPDLGSKYGAAGTGFLRLQIGMPRSELTGALTRLEAAARKCGFAQEAPYI